MELELYRRMITIQKRRNTRLDSGCSELEEDVKESRRIKKVRVKFIFSIMK